MSLARIFPSVMQYGIHLTGVSLVAIISTVVSAAEIQTDTAVLRWLDKVVARVSTIEAPVGLTFSIEGSTLRVIVRACVTRPLTETPESAAFLDIWEVKAGEPAIGVFRGWMFASSPALSAMEHPVYDVWVLACRNSSETGAGNSPQNGMAW